MGTHSWRFGASPTVGLVGFLVFFASPLCAQRLQGIVLDEFTHAPVKAADVELLGAKGKVVGRELTGPDGRFAIAIPKLGAYAVRVDALGYTSFTTHVFFADSSKEVSARVSLAPAPIALSGLNVTTTAVQRELEKVGFYRRENVGFGYFLTEKDIQERALTQVTDVFYGLPGVRVVCDPSDPSHCDVVSTRGVFSLTGGPCHPSVAIDGMVVDGPWSWMVSPQDIVGIEVYPSPAGVPVWAKYESPCGAILIWTKNH